MNSQPEQLQLLSLPTDQLLEKFGAGLHKPGSGSAAALMALLGCKLVVTVALLTEQKDRYQPIHGRIRDIRKQIQETIEPMLVKAFHDDSEAFHEVILARQARDEEKDDRKKRIFREAALEKLRVATDIPLSIAQQSLTVARLALYVFDNGFQAARGDSGVAVSTSVSAAQGAAFVMYLNLTYFKEGAWAQKVRAECDLIMRQIQELQMQLFSRVTQLQNEAPTERLLPFETEPDDEESTEE